MERLLLKARLVASALILLCPFGLAEAAVVTIDLDTEFSGGTEPEGSSPWARLILDDSSVGANTVRLTLDAFNLTDSEFISGWYVNFNPSLDPTLLAFSPVDVTDAVASISTGEDAFPAGGGGWFDILFDFPNGPPAARFTGGESVVYDATYTSTISVDDFNFSSFPGGGNGTWLTAAHVQGIGPDDALSGWIGGKVAENGPDEGPGVVPEPASLAIWGLGLVAVGLCRRRRKA